LILFYCAHRLYNALFRVYQAVTSMRFDARVYTARTLLENARVLY